MNLARTYAAVFAELGPKHADRALAYMKSRGHLSLLSGVVRVLEREPPRAGAVLTVAKESDAKRLSAPIAAALKSAGVAESEMRTAVDPRAVGGFAVRTRSRLVDKSFRSALVDIYKKAVHDASEPL